MTNYNPKDHLIDLRGKKYLDVRNRLVWFRAENPQGSVQTDIISVTPPIVKAFIYNNDGVLIASAHGTANAPKNGGNVVWAGREIEKAETAAIGRALGNAGYSTEAAMMYVVKAIAASTTVQEKKDKLGASGSRNLTGGANGHAKPANDDSAFIEPNIESVPQNATDPLVGAKNGNSQQSSNNGKPWKEADLWNAVLKTVYANNPIHMKKSLKKLLETNTINYYMPLDEVIEIVKHRHDLPEAG